MISKEVALTLVTANKAWDHARACKQDPTRCSTCQRNIVWFKDLPLNILSKVLAEHSPARRGIQVAPSDSRIVSSTTGA